VGEERGHGAAQRLDDLAAQALALGLAAVVQQRDTAGQVIEHQQRAWSNVMSVGRFRVVQAASRHSLEITHGVVRGVSHQAAGQGHAGDLRQGLGGAGERTAQRVQEGGFRSGPGGADPAYVKSGGIQTDLQTVAESDEGIPRQTLSAFHAFQQEPRLERPQFQIGRHRCVQIGGNVERWLHELPAIEFEDNKKPITTQVAEMGSG
jgi:hypothetical protein